MLQFKKCAPFEGTILLTPDPDGVDCLYTVVKATFDIADKVVPSEKQTPIVTGDLYYGEPDKSSVRVASDVTLVKPATDIILVGSACALGGEQVTQSDVTVRVGALQRTIRVFGDRIWDKAMLGHRVSDPEPFERMPLVWERAFGGTDVVPGEPPKTFGVESNPVGTGFRVKNGSADLTGLKLPNIENPEALISSWKHCPTPTGFAPICPHWLPRKSFAGTYDEAWQKQRAPYLPLDFDSRFFQQSPFVADRYLDGGEEVLVNGVHPSGTIRFELPRARFEIIHRFDTGAESVQAKLDTVVIHSDEKRLVMLWRSAIPCDKRALRVREVVVAPRRHQ